MFHYFMHVCCCCICSVFGLLNWTSRASFVNQSMHRIVMWGCRLQTGLCKLLLHFTRVRPFAAKYEAFRIYTFHSTLGVRDHLNHNDEFHSKSKSGIDVASQRFWELFVNISHNIEENRILYQKNRNHSLVLLEDLPKGILSNNKIRSDFWLTLYNIF